MGLVVSEEQGGFRKGRGCVDQIFAIKTVVEEYLGKGKKLYAAFMDLEKAYDKVDREALWNVKKNLWCRRAVIGRNEGILQRSLCEGGGGVE